MATRERATILDHFGTLLLMVEPVDMMLYPSAPEAATKFLNFVNASPTPFHAIHNAIVRLETAGFHKVHQPGLLLKSLIDLRKVRSEKRIIGRLK